LSSSLRKSRRRLKSLIERAEKLLRAERRELPTDPVEFCERILHIRPTSYQRRLLKLLAEGHRRIVLRWARQTGKTYILTAVLIWYCSTHPGSTALIVAPGLRQSLILSDRIHSLLNQMESSIRRGVVEKALRTIIRFRNGSQIVALPNSEHLLRGYTAHLVICDEAAFFHNDEAEFIEDEEAWLSQDLLAEAIDEELEYYCIGDRARGQFYIGLDLAERRDYTAIAVIQREGQLLKLVHRHKFPSEQA